MGMFGFDEQFAMFGTTPVDNQFLLEYLPMANGDYVKVYLYGLVLCYHPQADMSLTQMSKELHMSEDEIMAAYRHWERMGFVCRVSDNPVAYRYVNVRQRLLAGGAAVDQDYVAFTESMYAVFGKERNFHKTELQLAYEWVDELHLPTEVVLMLMRHMITIRGKNFSIKSAQPLAVELAEQHVQTIEDAEVVLSRSRKVWEGSKTVLRRFGKHREPSRDEQDMYLKWTRDWGFSPDAIEAACFETTGGDPSFKYLDAILKGMMNRQGKAFTSGAQVEQARKADQDEAAPLKTLLSAMNIGVSVNEGTLAMYRELRAIYPDDEVILMAARECRVKKNADLTDVQRMLASWQSKGLKGAAEVQAYIDEFKHQNEQAQELFSLWGVTDRPGAADRNRIKKWRETLGFSREMVVACAAFAKEAERPMQYLDKLLTEFARQGVTTPEQAEAANKAWLEKNQQTARKGGKVVHEQQYAQREYQDDDNELMRQIAEWKEQGGHA